MSPGNDGRIKEFPCTFWVTLKTHLKHICVSQRQVIIKLFEKPNKDKRYISNWRSISLLNFNLKVISKSLSTSVKSSFKSNWC